MIRQILFKFSRKNSTGGAAASAAAYEPLPCFCDVLGMCCVIFDFCDAGMYAREKELKRQMLLELVDYVSIVDTKFDETAVQEAIKMVTANIFFSLSYSGNRGDVEEEPALQPAWPHLQFVYEFFLMFVSSPETDVKIFNCYVNQSFILQLLHLFDSEDPREREYLKVIFHQIYEKFITHRHFIRKAIEKTFCKVIYEEEKHNGITELLEIVGCIINGFSMPLKQERELLLFKVLIPLHKSKCLALFHEFLSHCVTEIVKRDKKLADMAIQGLLMCWPPSNSPKEAMFLEEIEEILEVTRVPELKRCMVPLFKQVATCLKSIHVKVVERALFLWINVHVQKLISENLEVILPIISPDMGRNMEGYGN